NRELKIKGSESPYRERIENEGEAGIDSHVEVIEVSNNELSRGDSAAEATPAVEAVPAVDPAPTTIAEETTILQDAMPEEWPKTTVELSQTEEIETVVKAIPTAELEPVTEPAPSTVPLGEMESAATSLSEDEPKQCPNCGRINPPKAKFCSNCGQPFAQQ
ncbi:MAG: zinc-ribbon domain-containing protein, partial [Chloroflexia bacterium]